MSRPRFAVLGLLLWLAMLASCGQAADTVSPVSLPTALPTLSPTQEPSATPVPTYMTGSTIAGIAVGGLERAEAAERLAVALDVPETLDLRVGATRLRLDADVVALAAPLDELLAEADTDLRQGRAATVPLHFGFDEAALRQQLRALAPEVAREPVLRVVTATDALSRTFAYLPGQRLDVDAALAEVRAALAAGEAGPLTLTLQADPTPPTVALERLHEELAALTADLEGVLGLYLIDLASGETLGWNERSVFSGASTIKTAIMLYAYVNLPELSEEHEEWMSLMLRVSDNLAANDLLAAGAGGEGTAVAFTGAAAMSAMLQDELGLRHTYLHIPFEAIDYIRLYGPSFRCGPDGPVGERPYTEMGACLRAEPESMAQLYFMLDQCANGEGLLLEQYEHLKPRRCQAMLDWLALNEDTSRIVAGIPEGVRVEHKSGWVEDMQADVGIVRSPGGDYVLALYYYRPLPAGRDLWFDDEMTPVLSAISGLVYSAFNPSETR
ncbi:MAG: serine hydrolase [Candidatus Viridilinea halotolerans]|uniref:Serine hydrolase n=1 Tax=Candidatus Viridilinea halotolerans TaxID=2491704 RepID=A0A426U414_9CHLR|nr:MAG: serine hydrolase [Candidatus Viridilinea halotolerans]